MMIFRNTSTPPPKTKFTILHPDEGGKFVLTLDRSGSMHDFDRMVRLQQSAIRWLRYDVKNGTQIGITSFENSASRDKALTKLTEKNRQEFVDVIDRLKPNGGTCLGKGLMKGMDVSITVEHRGMLEST